VPGSTTPADGSGVSGQKTNQPFSLSSPAIFKELIIYFVMFPMLL